MYCLFNFSIAANVFVEPPRLGFPRYSAIAVAMAALLVPVLNLVNKFVLSAYCIIRILETKTWLKRGEEVRGRNGGNG